MNDFSPTGSFDASTVPPEQGGSKHPIGLYPFSIKNTDIAPSKDNDQSGNPKSVMFVVTFETPAGTIDKRYNLKHENNVAVEIAQKQLSALCHATGIFKLNWANKGRELVGGRGSIEVGWQKDQEPGSEKGGPNGGYVEVKKVFDAAGNEPGKAPAGAAPQPQQQPQQWSNPPQQQAPQQAPMQQQPSGGWNAPPQGQPQQQAPQGQPAWGNQAAPQNPPPWGK
jgi:hypothetical protein